MAVRLAGPVPDGLTKERMGAWWSLSVQLATESICLPVLLSFLGAVRSFHWGSVGFPSAHERPLACRGVSRGGCNP